MPLVKMLKCQNYMAGHQLKIKLRYTQLLTLCEVKVFGGMY